MTSKDPNHSVETRTRYGKAHPERVENALWELAVQNNWSGYELRGHHKSLSGDGGVCKDFSLSDYRVDTPGPFWSWQRFGRTSTLLPDGRVIHIAGEHEDSYDADFCIYNDVVVEYPGGRREFYLYPIDVFPPTDFHTATLIGDDIWLIGSLGYHDLRRPGETQVLKFDTRALRFETVATSGDGPGWVSDHSAEMISEKCVLIVGGKVQLVDDYVDNTGIFEFDLDRLTWQRREHGDERIFPIAPALYRSHKNPRFGKANPDRSDNPFWREMAARQWTPSRARLHFGDFAPPEPDFVLSDDPSGTGTEPPEYGTPESDAWMARLSADIERNKLKRSIDDVVWTSLREDALIMTLSDGRRLTIGGEIPDYGDEYADPWVYNDIIVTDSDGGIEILTYPKEVFPHLRSPVGVKWENNVFIFGIIARKLHPELSRGPAVLRLDTQSYEITPVDVSVPPGRVNVYAGAEIVEDERVIFPLVRKSGADPELGVAFDMVSLTWGDPFPHKPPHVDDDDD